MKRLLSAIIIGCLLVTPLASCNNNDDDGKAGKTTEAPKTTQKAPETEEPETTTPEATESTEAPDDSEDTKKPDDGGDSDDGGDETYESQVIENPDELVFEEPKNPRLAEKTEYDIDVASVDNITIYNGNPEYGVWKDTWYTDLIEEYFGIVIEIIPSGDGKIDTMIAGDNLPDIVTAMSIDQLKSAAKGGLLEPLSDHLDKMPNVAENAKYSIKYFAEQLGIGDGKAYGVAPIIVNDINVYGTPNPSPYLRYDLYLEVGAPHIETLMDYIPVLEAMHEIYPENEEGQKVFAVSSFPDWDNYWAAPGGLCDSFGAKHIGLSGRG